MQTTLFLYIKYQEDIIFYEELKSLFSIKKGP
jgi:hypothetical protein